MKLAQILGPFVLDYFKIIFAVNNLEIIL